MSEKFMNIHSLLSRRARARRNAANILTLFLNRRRAAATILAGAAFD